MARLFSLFCFLIGSIIHHLSAYELTIASMFYNEAPYLKEWIEYHRMVGVEHFWLYNNGSTDHWEEVLQPYIEGGIVEVTYHPTPAEGFFGATQLRAFKEGIRRAVGNAKWIALIDIDEFLLPMQDRTVTSV